MTREGTQESTSPYQKQNYDVYFNRGKILKKKDPYKTRNRSTKDSDKDVDHFSSCCKMLCTTLGFTIAGIVLFSAWDKLGRPGGHHTRGGQKKYSTGDFTHVMSSLNSAKWRQGFREDPFENDNTTYTWEMNSKDGLTLVIQNALDTSWETAFENAVYDWAESDVFSNITIKEVDIDHGCTRIYGVMKVCNGNYGENGWLGVNELALEYAAENRSGTIKSSLLKLNEFYLHNANYEQRQYTMCHEMGHGLGLPHIQQNKNQQGKNYGCMGITESPEENMHPGDVSIQKLASIYNWNNWRAGAGGIYNGDDDIYFNDNKYYYYEREDYNNYMREGDSNYKYISETESYWNYVSGQYSKYDQYNDYQYGDFDEDGNWVDYDYDYDNEEDEDGDENDGQDGDDVNDDNGGNRKRRLRARYVILRRYLMYRE